MTSMQSVDTLTQKYISINCEKFIIYNNEFEYISLLVSGIHAYIVHAMLLYDDIANRTRHYLLSSEGV